MEIAVFTKEYWPESIEQFMEHYYALQLKFLASDLLQQGLSPKQISDAVVKAISVGRSSGLNVREHFRPIFSGFAKDIVVDCKLSRMGYCLVLMNADKGLSAVAAFQLSVLENYLRI